eukprot:6680666-Pyramimonas_sp.AAC.2
MCRQIARRDYLPELAAVASLTARRYAQIGDFFRGRFGGHAGWAFMFLFAAELSLFKRQARTRLSMDNAQAAGKLFPPVATKRLSSFFQHKTGGTESEQPFDNGSDEDDRRRLAHPFRTWKRRKTR